MRSSDVSADGQVGSEQEFNALISDAAATLFWSHAAKYGFQATVHGIRTTRSVCLFEQQHVRGILEPYGFYRLPQENRHAVVQAICRVVNECIERKESLVGIVFPEDAATGRSPTALAVDATGVCSRPTRIFGHEQLERHGTLCLRHPLAAVVFSETQPKTSFIQVGSTRRALGCEVPMFLALSGCVEVSAQLFALSGLFHILVPDSEIGDPWNGVIQNSVRSTGQIAVEVNGVIRFIRAVWK